MYSTFHINCTHYTLKFFHFPHKFMTSYSKLSTILLHFTFLKTNFIIVNKLLKWIFDHLAMIKRLYNKEMTFSIIYATLGMFIKYTKKNEKQTPSTCLQICTCTHNEQPLPAILQYKNLAISFTLWYYKNYLWTPASSAVAYGNFLWKKNWFLITFL